MTGILRRAGLLAPSMLTVGILLILPLGLMAFVSTLERGPSGGVIWDRHTADAYVQFLFERDLTDRQSQRFARAYRETGADSVEGFRKVLLGLLDPAERVVVDKRVRGGGR